MQAVYTWIPGLGNKTPTPFPHEHHELACSKSRPALNFSPMPGLLKRSRSGTTDSLTAMSSPLKQSSLSSSLVPPPAKRQKLQGLGHAEEQAAPAAQEYTAALARPPLLPAVSAQSDTASCLSGQQPTHPRVDDSPQTQPIQDQSRLSGDGSVRSSSYPMTPQQRLRLKDKLKSHFDLQILRKHEELRLIEQEQAKAQIMLEQLRRCRQIPFPGQPGSLVTHDQILDGRAPALLPRRDCALPLAPAPWGVTDGPYARHYAKWLIPDSQFDAEPAPQQSQSTARRSSLSLDGSLRHNDAGSSHRRQRHSTGGKAHAAPSDQPQPTPKEKPALSVQIMRRPDGQLVKLHCPMCHMELYRSVQGFLNHYRIQHKSEIKSHAEAATRFGVPVDGPVLTSTPAVVESVNAVSAPAQRPSAHVHPLNVSGPTQGRASTAQSRADPSMDVLLENSSLNPNFQRQRREMQPDSTKATGSPDMPRLSALVKKIGGKIDVQALYANASAKVDLDAIQPLIPDNEIEEDVPMDRGAERRKPPVSEQVTPSSSQASRGPASGIRTLNKPPNIQVPQMKRVIPSSQSSSFDPLWPSSSPRTLSENNTVSPHTLAPSQDVQMNMLSPYANPPGLITDHEDDDEMEDEAKSVAESSAQGHGNVRIYNEHGDQEVPDVSAETKEPRPTWKHPQPIASEQSSETGSRQGNQKKRRGRPSKKGKEKMCK